MDDLVKKYLQNKYGENFEQDAQNQYDERSSSLNTANLFSNLGDVIAGNKVGSANEYFSGLKKQAKDDTLGKIEKARNDYVKNITDNSAIEKIVDESKIREQENQTGSEQAKAVTAQLKRLGVQVPDGLSLAEIKRNYGDAKTLNELKMRSNIDFGNQVALKSLDFKNQESKDARTLEREKEMAAYKQELERTKKSDPKTLGGTDKARFDNALMAIKGLDQMAKALDSGENTFSLVGDNPYTIGSRAATEAYGRMQSGGAINKDEEARFEKTLPSATDSKQIQRQKLINQRNEMISRLKTLGFDAKDIGVEPLNFKYGSEESSQPKTVIQNGHTYTFNPKTGQYE